MDSMIEKRPDIDWFYNREELRQRTYEEIRESRNEGFEEKLATMRFGKSLIPKRYLEDVKAYMERLENNQNEEVNEDEVKLTDEDILNYVQQGQVFNEMTPEEYEAAYDVRE